MTLFGVCSTALGLHLSQLMKPFDHPVTAMPSAEAQQHSPSPYVVLSSSSKYW